MEARIKFILLLILALMWGGAQWAKADDEISCATDNECIKAKADAGYEQWQQDQAKHKTKKRQAKSKQPEEVKPCAADDECQRSKLDAIDRENGKGGQED